MTVEEIKIKIEKLKKTAESSLTPEALKPSLQQSIAKLQQELDALEGAAEKKVEVAEKKVEEAKKEEKKAETPTEKKEAKAEVKEAEKEKKEAKDEVKEVQQVAKKAETVEEKIKRIHGGRRVGAGRPRVERPVRERGAHGGSRTGAGRKRKASVPTKMVKPAKVAKTVEKAEKTKSVRAFGQNVEYKNDADFCKQLIKAFKKRKLASKKAGARRKTKPVFGAITTSVKNAVSKALYSVSEKQIEKNPKAFLAKATRLEKSAIRFLEDFKAILGSDYKKSEITAEFGELEKSIKNFVAKFSNK